MKRAFDMLSRPRYAAPPPACPMQFVPPMANMPMNQPQSQPQQVLVRPLEIPPMVPAPRSPTIYRQLMQNHDRMCGRHLKTK